VNITGLDNIPKSGSYIIAINHISIIEPPLVIAFWPKAPEAVGAKEIWERKGQSSLARFYGGIQVHRGEYDRRVIEAMIQVIQSGHPLLIAPEGGRSHSPPVLPVGIVGSTDDFLHKALRLKRPVLEMRIGETITLPNVEGRGEQRRESLKRNTDMIMYKIAELLPPGYRGVYANGNFDFSKTA
jgi:1-acyl-sn-glycerol-3-phosphate acyltransferase